VNPLRVFIGTRTILVVCTFFVSVALSEHVPSAFRPNADDAPAHGAPTWTIYNSAFSALREVLRLHPLAVTFGGAQHPTDERRWVDRSPHKSGFVQVNGIKLHDLDWGGQGETLLFLAGLGHNAHIFDALAPRFTAHFHVLAMTRRGFGLSDKPATGYDIETRVADLLGFLDALRIKRVILVGHSIAGDELTGFAASYPDRVGKLIYLDAAYDRSEAPDAEAVKSGKEPPGSPPIPPEAFASLDAYLTYFRKQFSSVWCDAFEASLRDGIVIHGDGSVDRRTSDNVYRAIRKGTFLAHLDYTKVKPPTLSFYSDPATSQNPAARERSMEWQRRDIELLKKSGPQIQIAQIPGASHYLFIDHLDEVVGKMNVFLERSQR
jgi:pimeloyl-ACP methyl ester carboxylesterase